MVMNSIINLDGKFYEKCKIVVLPTDKACSLYLLHGKLNLSLHGNITQNDSDKEPQTLYFLSDEKCKQGEYKYCSFTNQITKYDQFAEIDGTGWCEYCKKIIATTDESLKVGTNNCDGCLAGIPLEGILHRMGEGNYPDFMSCQKHKYITKLPRPSNEFLQAYCKANGKINEVLVEYEENCSVEKINEKRDWSHRDKSGQSNFYINNNYKLKVAPDNTIIIRMIEVSKTPLLDQLKEYLKNTPKDQIKKDWEEIEEIGFGGPTIKEYLGITDKSDEISIEEAAKKYTHCYAFIDGAKSEAAKQYWQKGMYSKEEVIQLIKSFREYDNSIEGFQGFDKWIEENLK